MIYGLWAVAGYWSDGDTDIERFEDEQAAAQALADRYRLGHSFLQRFDYVNREPQRALTPCVGSDSTMLLYAYDPTGNPDPYPDKRITLNDDGDPQFEEV